LTDQALLGTLLIMESRFTSMSLYQGESILVTEHHGSKPAKLVNFEPTTCPKQRRILLLKHIESRFNIFRSDNEEKHELVDLKISKQLKQFNNSVNLQPVPCPKQRRIFLQNHIESRSNSIRLHNEEKHELIDSMVSKQLKQFNNFYPVAKATIHFPSIDHDSNVRRLTTKYRTATRYLTFADEASETPINEALSMKNLPCPPGLTEAILQDAIEKPNFALAKYAICPSKKRHFSLSYSPLCEDKSSSLTSRKMLRRNAFV